MDGWKDANYATDDILMNGNFVMSPPSRMRRRRPADACAATVSHASRLNVLGTCPYTARFELTAVALGNAVTKGSVHGKERQEAI